MIELSDLILLKLKLFNKFMPNLAETTKSLGDRTWNEAQQTDYTIPSLSSSLVFALYYANKATTNATNAL